MEEFVEDWMMYDTILGEGAYGEVKLVVNKVTEEKVACKIIDLEKLRGSENVVQREITIHKCLNHENIIKYYGLRKERNKMYLFLEYASGGELFQQIEPGVGMPIKEAQYLMRQLVNGVIYLHQKGIAHRDIKPENILLTDDGTVKISDFGMATIFRLKGKERKLEKRCGTKPYLAHEIMLGPYRAQPADVWSCGCVLAAMLAGELLWNAPFDTHSSFLRYKQGNYLSHSPWNRLSNSAISLITKMVHLDPKERITLDKVLTHPWITNDFDDSTQESEKSSNDMKRRCSMFDSDVAKSSEVPKVAMSQPTLSSWSYSSIEKFVTVEKKPKKDAVCFSQPIHNDDLMLSSEIQFTQTPITKDNFHHLIKRMTRFFVTTTHAEAIAKLTAALDVLHYPWIIDGYGAIAVNTVDNLKNQLVFKATPIEMEGKILLDFRLSKGCGLEFKKKFMVVKGNLKDIIDTV